MVYQLVDGYTQHDPRIRALLDTVEFRFVVLANPDGYMYVYDQFRFEACLS